MIVITIARKPLAGSVATNTLQHGTGGINIDASRLSTPDNTSRLCHNPGIWTEHGGVACGTDTFTHGGHPEGRWPPNLLLEHKPDCVNDQDWECVPECPVALLDEESLAGGMHPAGHARDGSQAQAGDYVATSYKLPLNRRMRRLGDRGGASKFFKQVGGRSSD